MTDPAGAIRVVLADDETLVRAGLRMLLEGEPDVVVAGEAADGRAAVRTALDVRADVVLMDVRMPGLDGIGAAHALTEAGSPARVLVLTTFDEDETLEAALRAGVAGFLLKTAPPEDMLDALRRVAAGQGALDPSVVPRVVAAVARSRPRPAAPPALTAREAEVLAEVARGLSNAEVAARLHLGETTVNTHLGRVLDKLGLPDRPRVIAWAWRHGVVDADDGP
ncbi:DNA-binding response regulator [Actinomycetospora sp. NBRC 106375]|uniref:response regulator n=1 Tax=Actinomycetospora sp. NBRC 106375 TaxID=3032207 RepID=UPI0024A2BC1B|nr:response regulator transcription factor [Actinomycetospora sp. NBRC 106375]GLZ44311.1 DNA-binding response regulator [Actinomycetospora sp. NBRC 106375]